MLDILTPKGMATVKEENEAARLFEAEYPNFLYLRTPKDSPSPVDAVIANKRQILCVIECKCRQMTLKTLAGKFSWEWLVTGAKLTDGIAVAEALSVPFAGFLYLVPEKRLLIQRIWGPKTGYCATIRWDKTETQATVNGGIAMRMNAFINMQNATIID